MISGEFIFILIFLGNQFDLLLEVQMIREAIGMISWDSRFLLVLSSGPSTVLGNGKVRYEYLFDFAIHIHDL